MNINSPYIQHFLADKLFQDVSDDNRLNKCFVEKLFTGQDLSESNATNGNILFLSFGISFAQNLGGSDT